jgi:dTDP-4-amino-4,6-dideoxygalactose transaminase
MNAVRLSKSSVGQEEKDAVCRVLDAGYLGMGTEVKLFEQEIATYLGTDMEVVCVNTGTAALHLALLALGIGDGDEVLVPSITYVASFQAIAATGARAIACDVTTDRVFIDLDDAAKRLTDKTRAIMPVHYASDSQDMGAVYKFARANGLRVVEDAAHAFGGRRDGAKIGTVGDVVCFSFDGIKNITSGEGGAILTSDKELAVRLQDARLLGVEKDTQMRYEGKRSWRFEVQHIGLRYHMSNIMAAIGREQLKKLGRFKAHRKNCVSLYRTSLQQMDDIGFLDLDYENIVSHIFPVIVKNDRRDALMDYLKSTGIECGLHYQPNHWLKLHAVDYVLPNSDYLAQRLLSLPLHADLSVPDQTRVIQEIRSFLTHSA